MSDYDGRKSPFRKDALDKRNCAARYSGDYADGMVYGKCHITICACKNFERQTVKLKASICRNCDRS